MGMLRFSALAGVSLLGLSLPAYAQDNASANDAPSAVTADDIAEQSDEIVVTGTLVRGIAPPGTNVIGVTERANEETGAATTRSF